MPAAVASRTGPRDLANKKSKNNKAGQSSGLDALLNGPPDAKPVVKAKTSKNVRSKKRDNVDEATAVVGGGQAGHGDVDMGEAPPDVIEISSAEESSDYSSSDDAGDQKNEDNAPVANGHGNEEHADAPVEEDAEELSFGERLQAQEPEPDHEPHQHPTQVVDVEAAFVGPNAESRALATASHSRPLSAPSASSLGTVLTQALRTNDRELLDSCLRVIDVDTIYATIERLPSPLVGSLLQKLSERLHKKGRPGMLMVWVQWCLVAHGGYLASQPHLVKQLAALNKVLKERASGLQPLLSLKGRLDMLQAQLELRRRNKKSAANDDEDEAVIYIEGEDDDMSSADEDDQSANGDDANEAVSRKRLRQDDDDEGSSDDAMPTTMELDEAADDEGSEDSEEDLLDEEAEETDNDTGDEEMSEALSDDKDGIDNADGGASGSEEESRPARRSTAGRAGMGRHR